jgi:tetratricopeptide (TPR) repeat protein
MKIIKYIIVVLLFSQLIIAQDKNDIAKSYYLNAENFYSTGRYNESVSELEKSIETLGNTNAKIQYLKVKSLLGNAENDPFDLVSLLRARYDLKLFFKLVDKNNFNKEKYDEIIKNITKRLFLTMNQLGIVI